MLLANQTQSSHNCALVYERLRCSQTLLLRRKRKKERKKTDNPREEYLDTHTHTLEIVKFFCEVA